MRVIGLMGLLRHLFVRPEKKPIRIFLLRGGFGNQLFQIAGISHFSRINNFNVIFCDSDVRLNPRDRINRNSLDIDFSSWFSPDISIYKSSKFLNHVVRVLRSKKLQTFSLEEIHSVDLDRRRMSKILFLSGYMQESIYADSIEKENLVIPFQKETLPLIKKVAIHMRGKDGLKQESMRLDLNYYQNALEQLGIEPNVQIDVYSDDSKYSRQMCSEIRGFRFNFPEEEFCYTPEVLIAELTQYEYLIGSKSTLSWWASYLSVNLSKDRKVVSPWENPLSIEGAIYVQGKQN